MSMRYEKADNLLQLALEMQAARYGLSLQDIQQRFAVGRRTAMRMRDAVLRNFPQAIEVPTGEKTKRWRIPHGVLDRLISFTADELADLEGAVALMQAQGQHDKAGRLRDLRGKLKVLMPPDMARRTEPDIDAMLEAEGFAMRAGPRPKITGVVMGELRDAVKACTATAAGAPSTSVSCIHTAFCSGTAIIWSPITNTQRPIKWRCSAWPTSKV